MKILNGKSAVIDSMTPVAKLEFSRIDSLGKLKPYICFKALGTKKDWWSVCLECEAKCDAGKRAIELLETATRPTGDTPQFREARKKSYIKRHEEAVALARQVFAASGDPAEFLAKKAGCSRDTARSRINYWARNFPDLEKELGIREAMRKYSKQRKQPASSVEEKEHAVFGDKDEIAIGDLLKAADEGRVKTDSVEETENSDSEIKRKLLEQFAEDCDAGAVHLPCWGVPKTQHDNVNRPGHYTFGAIEVIDYIRDKMTPEMFQGFCMGNVLKYVSRHKHKNGVEDLKKANVYLGWLIESEEKGNA